MSTQVLAPHRPAVARTGHGLGPWRLEWLRLVRTPRLFAVVAVYLLFGLAGPLLARYMSELLRLAGPSTVEVTAQAARPQDGLYNYVAQVSQTGVIVVVVVAAGAVAFDARRGVSVFLRSRTRHLRDLVLPR
jgi:ABC-2 type transport system permease protein